MLSFFFSGETNGIYVYNGWKVGIVYPNHSLHLSLTLIKSMRVSGGKCE